MIKKLLSLVCLSVFALSLQGQNFKPQDALPDLMKVYGGGLRFEAFIEQEAAKFARIDSVLKGVLPDTLFNLNQNRFYDFLNGYISQKDNLPLNTLSANDLADYAVGYMQNLEDQRNAADILYNHVKHQVATWLIPDAKPKDTRKILEGIELLGRGVIRLVVEKDLTDADALVNHMDDRRVGQLLRGLAKIQRKSMELDTLQLTAFGRTKWQITGDYGADLQKAFQKLSEPINKRTLENYHQHLVALVKFQEAYSQLIGKVFEWYLDTGYQTDPDLRVNSNAPIGELKRRWNKIKQINKSTFNLEVDPDQSISWMQGDLKGEYFKIRRLFRNLKFIDDTDKVTAMTRRKVASLMDSAVQEWNAVLTQGQIALDKQRASLTKLIETALPKSLDNLLADQLKRVDKHYKELLLASANLTPDALDSLILSEDQEKLLAEQIEVARVHFLKVKAILDEPQGLLNSLPGDFKLVATWQDQSHVKYEVHQVIKSNGLGDFERSIPLGISTPLIEIDQSLWQKEINDFKATWANRLNDLELFVNEELNNFLHSYGFPGTVSISSQGLKVAGGIPFNWLDQAWKLEFDDLGLADDTIRFDLTQARNPDFWSAQLKEIAESKWADVKNQLWTQVSTELEDMLLDLNPQFPDLLRGVLRGDELIYRYDLGNAVSSMSGAQILFKYRQQAWTVDYIIPPSVVIAHIAATLPVLDFSEFVYDSTAREFAGPLNLVVESSKIKIGSGVISESGKLAFTSIKPEREIEISKGFFVRAGHVELEVGKEGSKVMLETLLLNGKDGTLEDVLEEVEGDASIIISLRPKFSATFGEVKKDRILELIGSYMRARGLLPAGVRITDVRIDSKGIYPEFEVDPALAADVRQRVEAHVEELKEIPAQVLKDPRLVEIGNQAKALQATYNSWELEEKLATLELLRNALGPQRKASDVVRLLTVIRPSNTITLDNGASFVLENEGNEIVNIKAIVPGFGCEQEGLFSIEIDGNDYDLQVEDCLKKFAGDYFGQKPIRTSRWEIRFEPNNMQFVISGIMAEFPLEMTIGLDGAIGWNYSLDNIKRAVIDPMVEELEQEAKKQLDQLSLDASRNIQAVGSDIIDQWEQVFTSMGLQLVNKNDLRNTLQNQSLTQLIDLTLEAHLRGVSGVMEGIDIKGVELELDEGFVPDFNNASADLRPLTDKINAWSNLVQVDGPLTYQSGTITGTLQMSIPEFQNIPVGLRIDVLNPSVSLTDPKELIFNQIGTVISQKILPYQMGNEDVSLSLESVQTTFPKIFLNGTLNIATDGSFSIPIPVTLIFDLDRGSFELRPVDDLKSIVMRVAGQLLNFLSLPLLDDNDWIDKVELYPQGGIPEGILISGQAPLWNVADISIPGLIISYKGVRFADSGGIGIKFNSLEIPLPPFKLTHFKGALEGSELSLSAKLTLTPPQSERIIYAEGTFTVDLDKPDVLKTRTDLVALTFINLGYSESTLDIGEGYYDMIIDMGGALEDIISLKGSAEIRAKEMKVDAKGKVYIFGEEMASGTLKLDLDERLIVSKSKIDIPVAGSIGSHFSTERNFSRPTIGASKDLKVWKFTLAGTRFLVSPNTASAQFKVLGLSLGLQVPGYKQLDSDAFKKLLENLLSPDFENLDEALKALLSGNITLNPFTGFGPGGGAVGGSDGDGGDGGSSGTTGDGDQGYENDSGVQSDTQGAKGVAPGSVQKTVEATPDHLQPVDKEPVGDGKTPVAVTGTYSFPVKKEADGSFRAHELNSEKPDSDELVTYVISPDSLRDHFIKRGEEYLSAGIMLTASQNYYAHILKQGLSTSDCGDSHATLNWYYGPDRPSLKHISLPFNDLKPVFGSICYSDLQAKFANDKAFGQWLMGLASAVGNNAMSMHPETLIAETDGSLFKFDAPAGMYAIAVRFYNHLDHMLIISTNESHQVLNVPELELIEQNSGAQRSLLELARRHSKTSIGLYKRDNTLYLYTGCDPDLKGEFLYKLVGDRFEEESVKKTDCEKEVEPPSPEPKPISPPNFGTPFPGAPGNCQIVAVRKQNHVEMSCGPQGYPFAFFPASSQGRALFNGAVGQAATLNSPTVGFLDVGHQVFIIEQGGTQSVLWTSGREEFIESEVKLGGSGQIPTINYIVNPANIAVQGAFLEFTGRVTSMLGSSHSLNAQSVKYIESNDLTIIIAQFDGRPESEYWVFAGNKHSQKSISRQFHSGTVSIDQLPNFENHLISITK